MSYSISFAIVVILIILFAWDIGRAILSKDKSRIWSPITFIEMTYVYYIIMPFFSVDGRDFMAQECNRAFLLYIGALLYYVSILFAFNRTSPGNFTRWNSALNHNNYKAIAIILFVVAFASYVPFRGLHFTVARSENGYAVAAREGWVNYFLSLLDMLFMSSSLFVVSYKKKKNIWLLLVIWICVVTFIVAGFRYRIVIFTIALLTTWYLYPLPQRVNYIPLAIIAVSLYLGFAVMEHSRSYSQGLDMEVVKNMSLKEMSEGANENDAVCLFSGGCMNYFEEHRDFFYFEPLITAVLMPLPRSFVSWKPDSGYLREMQELTVGSSESGAACFSFVEGFMSFGWIGIIIYGLLLGWLSKKFWGNYCNYPDSIGAIVMLSIYNGFCYINISRGYLANSLMVLLIDIALPCWIAMTYNSIHKVNK